MHKYKYSKKGYGIYIKRKYSREKGNAKTQTFWLAVNRQKEKELQESILGITSAKDCSLKVGKILSV